MKKASVIWIVITLAVLIQAEKVFADAVYLKNGTVMTGRIVEKTPDYIVLKTSEDEDAVRVTVFLEDVYKIEEQEEFVEKLKLIPFNLRRSAVERGFSAGTRAGLSLQEGDSLTQVKSLLAQDRQYQAEVAEKKRQEISRIVHVEGLDDVSGLRQEKGYADFSRPLEKIKQKKRDTPRIGDGSISGYVILPDISYAKRMKGNLYVYLMEDLGDGQFIFGEDALFEKINYNRIGSRKVFYSVQHVPAGRYKVMAQWDIELPFIEEKSSREGKAGLSYLGAKGDYSGGHHEIVDLKPDEKKEGVVFSCDEMIREDQFSFDLGKTPSVIVKDVYYRKLPLEEGKIILLVENNTDGFISLAAFDILINDEKVLSLPYEVNGMEPRSEKEFDITRAYILYRDKQILKNEKGFLSVVKIKIIWPPTKEVVFEKVVQVF